MVKKSLSSTKLSIKSSFFPLKFAVQSKRYRATVGIGGNVGDVMRRFDKLILFLQRDRQLQLIATGSILKNPPFGFVDQPYFYNSVIHISTNLTSKALLRHLLRIEKRFGRKRSFQNAPRTLDLDLIFFENETKMSKTLTLPHPHWHERASVVLPLVDMDLVA